MSKKNLTAVIIVESIYLAPSYPQGAEYPRLLYTLSFIKPTGNNVKYDVNPARIMAVFNALPKPDKVIYQKDSLTKSYFWSCNPYE